MKKFYKTHNIKNIIEVGDYVLCQIGKRVWIPAKISRIGHRYYTASYSDRTSDLFELKDILKIDRYTFISIRRRELSTGMAKDLSKKCHLKTFNPNIPVKENAKRLTRKASVVSEVVPLKTFVLASDMVNLIANSVTEDMYKKLSSLGRVINLEGSRKTGYVLGIASPRRMCEILVLSISEKNLEFSFTKVLQVSDDEKLNATILDFIKDNNCRLTYEQFLFARQEYQLVNGLQ